MIQKPCVVVNPPFDLSELTGIDSDVELEEYNSSDLIDELWIRAKKSFDSKESRVRESVLKRSLESIGMGFR